MKMTKIALVGLIGGLLSCFSVGCSESAGTNSAARGSGDDDDWAGSDADADADADSDVDVDADADADGDSDDLGGWEEPGNDPPESDTDSGNEFDGGLDGADAAPGTCDTQNEVTLFLSADDSNSMASPVLVRSLINSGEIVPPNRVRVHEFLNYYDFDYPAEPSGKVGVFAQMRSSATVDGGYDLQLAVRAPDRSSATRSRLNLTLSIDTSGSMKNTPLQYIKESCLSIAGSLVSGDVVSVISWSTGQNVLLPARTVSGPNDLQLIDVCNELTASGSTDLSAALKKAYEVATEYRSRDRINRVILFSDGGANAGVTDVNLIAAEADNAEEGAIYLMGVGVGQAGAYHDNLMNIITDAGKGSYIFIDSLEEVHRAFRDRFVQNVDLAALDVQVRLSLPPSFKMFAYYGEEFSSNPENVEPQHLAPNDAMVFHQVVSSCAPDFLIPGEHTLTLRADFIDPINNDKRVSSQSYTLETLLNGDNSALIKGNAIVAYAEAIRRVADFSNAIALDHIDKVLEQVTDASAYLSSDEELNEIASLLTIYRKNFE
jgi:Ca-activated chloride channel homolog